MVELCGLSLSYRQGERVLSGISMNIKRGECILLTGKSGSGKSSIINTINGLSTRYDGALSEGEIRIGGRSIGELELYEISKLVSSVFQNPKTHFFNVNTTVELLFYLENIGLSREKMDERLEEMLKLFPIQHLLNRDIFKLSGGEKQILCIAASYIAGTDVIVLDEPSSNLDEKNIELVREMLEKLKGRGITLIIAEHRIYYLMDIADRVFLIADGELKREYDIESFKALSLKELNELGLRDKLKTSLRVAENRNMGGFEIKSLELALKGVGRRLSLKNTAFEVGRIYGITGTNGLGKSSFIRCLIGVEKASREEIYLNGRLLSKKDRLKLSSLVMQDVNHQLFTASVMDEAALGIKNMDKDRLEAILKGLNLYELRDAHPMSLSGGQKQRVAIASVLYKDSRLVFFDEPTSGMDFANMMKISALIRENKREDKIIFIVSHDAEFLNATADYILHIQ